MMIAAASHSLKELLEDRYDAGEGQAPTFQLLTSGELNDQGITRSNHVTLFLYRVSVDSTRRHIERPGLVARAPSRFSLGLELRYVLSVWGSSAEGEQEMLGQCMEILDREAIVAGSLLNTTHYAWEEGDALKLSIDELSNEDLLRLWDSFVPAYQLSVPYLVRTIRLGEVARRGGVVEDKSLVWDRKKDAPLSRVGA